MGKVSFDFTGQTALITGGAQGIGFEITKQFLTSGAQVVVWDYSQDALEACKNELSQFGEKLHIHQADVTKRDSLQKAAQALPSNITCLVNNAGITRDKSFSKMTDEMFDAVIQTNLTGLYNVTKSVFEKFDGNTAHKSIINISSVVGLYGNFGQTNYAAAKSGVIGMTKTLGKELGRKGFTVNAVAPGFISTAMTEAMPKEVLDSMASKVPLQRLGQTTDIANTCLFLASDAGAYINASVVSVDGGIVL